MVRIICLILLLCTYSASAAELKHCIIFIADGWGFNHIAVTDNWSDKPQVYENFPIRLAMSTYSWSTLQHDSLGYDAQRAHSDWNYLLEHPTESAAAATALASGMKVRSGILNMDPVTQAPLKTVVQRAEELGKSTGVVTSVQWSHATPAGFVAHDSARSNYAAIAVEMLDSSGCEVIMGCGHPFYDNNGDTSGSAEYKYVGGADQWSVLTSGRTAFTLIESRAQFQMLMSGDTPARVCGTARVRGTLQQERAPQDSAHSVTPPDAVPLLESVPTLAEMTRGALNVLDNNPQGFVVMIEGGAVDWASHNNQLRRCIEEMLSFNDAVQAAIEWVEAHSNWDETLMIITGDHECGYLHGPDSGPPATWNPVIDNGPGKLPSAHFYADKHSNSLIPFFAKGSGSAQFTARATRTDPQRGAYLDNTDIAKVIFDSFSQ